MFGLSLRKITQGLAKDGVDSVKDSGQLERNLNVLAESIASLSKSTNTISASGESESYKGSEGDIKINKTGQDKYDFLIRGQDGWHKDNNASFGPLDENKDLEDPPTVNMTSGNFDYSYEGNPRLSLNLDPSKSSTGSVATPVIKGFGNLKIESTGTTILQSALRLSSVAASGLDTDKFLNIDSLGNLGYRTGTQLLSDLGITAGEIIDWTGASAGTIHATNYTDTNTTYSVGDGGLTTNDFTNADHTKLNEIEALADVTDATNVTAAGALMDSECTNLSAVKAFTGEAAATADQTAGEILTLIEDGVDTEHIADDAIEEEHIGDGEVKTTAIADNAVTEDKLADTLLAEIDANTAKATNVSTDLTATANGTSLTINSSDGDNVSLPAATNSAWGVMSDDLVTALEANTAKSTNATHSGDVTGSGALTIAADAVTYAKMQNVSATDKILGRDSAGAGIIEEISPANLRTMINVEDGATADQTRADVEGLAIREVGILAGGSITNSFGTINNGASAITTTGRLTGGQTYVMPATLTASAAGDTTALAISQTLNAASGTNSGLVAEIYSALQMNITETDSAGFDAQNFINCEGSGTGTTEKFKVALDGNVTAAGTVTSSNGVCGGLGKWVQVWSARVYQKYDNWYHPNSTYGPGYYQWSSAVTSIPSTWGDDRNPIIVVPHDCVLNSYYIYGNINNNETIEFALMTGTNMAWDDSNGDVYDLTQVGATQSSDWTSVRGNKLGQTGLSVSLSEGDNLIPFVRKTTNDNSTQRYIESNFTIVATLV